MNGEPPRAIPPASPPLSPCIKVCRMDARNEYCVGCSRTLREIAQWWSLRDDEKRAVLAALAQRRATR
jgi:predicted Fe-S protein YdhL (DUF1289 family)